MKLKSMLIASALIASCGTVLVVQAADTPFQAKHPRREQVNQRLHNQNKRIHEEVKEGDLTRAQAATLHRDDRKIRQEERDMASQNKGHLTKQEDKTLNQQENQLSKEIGH